MEHIRINDNLRLERVKLSMAETIFNTIDQNREKLKTWLPFVESTKHVSDTIKFLHSVVHSSPKKRNDIYSIWYKEKFAGIIGFKDTDWINGKSELGYWLSPEMEGKGIATQCVEMLTKYAFQKLKLNRIQIKVAIGNLKSAAIPKRLNFKFEGVERSGEKHLNKYLDLEIYSLLKSD